MDVNKVFDRDKEVSHLKRELRRTVRLSKAIWDERDTIETIKLLLEDGNPEYAKGIWDDLELETQELLITAPSKGGAFTTQERAEITKFWRTVGI